MPPYVAAPSIGEGGQPVGEVGLVVAAKVTPSAPSFVLATRKRDDATGPFGRKKSKALVSLCALRQVAGLMPSSSRPSSLQHIPPATLCVKASASTIVVVVTPTLPPHHVVSV